MYVYSAISIHLHPLPQASVSVRLGCCRTTALCREDVRGTIATIRLEIENTTRPLPRHCRPMGKLLYVLLFVKKIYDLLFYNSI